MTSNIPEGDGGSDAGDPAHGPAWDVEVTIDMGRPTYANLASRLYGPETEAWWVALGDLLGGRPGWHCEFTQLTDHNGLLWSFGAFGSSLFNISAPRDPGDFASGALEIYDFEGDTTYRFAGTDELLAWLEDNEHRHADHVSNLRPLASAFGWKVLKTMGVDLRVTHDGSSFIATFPDLPFESAAASDLSTLLAHARQAVARAHGAPDWVTTEIGLRVHLDPAASRAAS